MESNICGNIDLLAAIFKADKDKLRTKQEVGRTGRIYRYARATG